MSSVTMEIMITKRGRSDTGGILYTTRGAARSGDILSAAGALAGRTTESRRASVIGARRRGGEAAGERISGFPPTGFLIQVRGGIIAGVILGATFGKQSDADDPDVAITLLP